MNPFLKSPEDRLKSWKQLRKDIANLDEMTQMKEVAKYWSQCPIIKYIFDWTNPQSWPTPWEMIYDGDIDQNSIAYLMEQTFVLDNWDEQRFKLVMIRDNTHNDNFMILIIDDQYVLNYNNGNIEKLEEIKEYCEFLEKYILKNKIHIPF